MSAPDTTEDVRTRFAVTIAGELVTAVPVPACMIAEIAQMAFVQLAEPEATDPEDPTGPLVGLTAENVQMLVTVDGVELSVVEAAEAARAKADLTRDPRYAVVLEALRHASPEDPALAVIEALRALDD